MDYKVVHGAVAVVQVVQVVRHKVEVVPPDSEEVQSFLAEVRHLEKWIKLIRIILTLSWTYNWPVDKPGSEGVDKRSCPFFFQKKCSLLT